MLPAWVVVAWASLEVELVSAAVADAALVPADLLALEAAAQVPAVLRVVGPKDALKPDPAAVIVVVRKDGPKVEIAVGRKADLVVVEIVDLTVVLLKVARAAGTVDRIADLRVIVAARKMKRFSCC
ncbi:MAG: hypothetical protein ACKVP0_13960 [Pirellulaceae bacterium]